MARKLVLSKEAEVLLKLLRIALGTEPDGNLSGPVEQFPEDINWKKVVKLSYDQKVSALAADGLQASGYDPYKGLDGKRAEELKAVLEPWINDVENTEWSYCYYVEVLKTLCQIFISNGLTPIILKGYGLGLNYPRASHRGAGDIDIFLIDKDGKPAAEKGVEVVENILKIKTKKVPHDYEFEFKSIEVELHYDTTNAYWNSPSEDYIVRRLTELLLDGYVPCPEIEGAYLPSATFNALYLVRHTFGHFYTASGNFRQYTDWVMFLKNHSGEVDWKTVGEGLEKSGMKPYLDGLHTMLSGWLGISMDLCPIALESGQTQRLTVKDMNCYVSNGRHLHQRVRYYYTNREKLKFISGKGWMRMLVGSVAESVKKLVMSTFS